MSMIKVMFNKVFRKKNYLEEDMFNYIMAMLESWVAVNYRKKPLVSVSEFKHFVDRFKKNGLSDDDFVFLSAFEEGVKRKRALYSNDSEKSNLSIN